MRRLVSSNRRSFARLGLAAVVGLFAALTVTVPGHAGPGTPTDAPVAPAPALLAANGCVPAAEATFWHTFTIDPVKHTARATVFLRGELPLCGGGRQAFTLVSYLANDPRFTVPQHVFDSATKTMDSSGLGFALQITVPECFTQVALVLADRAIDPITVEDPYGDAKAGSDTGDGSRSVPVATWPKHAWSSGGCQTAPTVQSAPHCDGSLTVDLANGRDAQSTVYVIKGEGGYTKELTLSGGSPSTQVEVPAAAAGHVTVSVGDAVVKTIDWRRPAGCEQASVTRTVSCTSASITIANPAGNTAAVATILVEGSTEPQTITVAAGTRQTIAAAVGLKVSVTVFGDTSIVDLAPPADCASSSAPGLAVTGANAAAAGGVAGVLLLAGTGLFLLARRRRVRFTA